MNGSYLGSVVRDRECDQCGRRIVKAHRVHKGGSYCSSCYPRLFPVRECTVCGKPARAHKDEAEPVCRGCRLADRTCVRCRKLTPRGALRVGDGIACSSCARYFKPLESCSLCEQPSRRLSALSSAPEVGRICEKCRRDQVAATCSCCGKHRTVHFVRMDRSPLCRACIADPNARHSCPDCGVDVGGSGGAPCFSCSIKRSNRRKIQAAEGLFQTQAVRQLIRDFHDWTDGRGDANKFAANAGRYVAYLAKLDGALADASREPSNAMLMRTFSTEDLRRMGLLTQYLAEIGTLTADGDQRRTNTEMRLIEEKLREATRQPWGAEITKYHAYLVEAREKKLSERSVRVYLSSAISLMRSSGKTETRSLTQSDVEKYLRRTPGARASLSSYLRYVEATTSTRFELVSKKRPSKVKRGKIREASVLLKALAAEGSWPARRGCLARLLSLLYARPVLDIVKLRASDVREYKSGYQIRFHGDWCAIEPEISPGLKQLLSEVAQQRLVHDPWLFPGRSANDHLSPAAVVSIVRRIVAV